MEPNSPRKQDIFVSKSEIYFENKWDPVEIHEHNTNFLEFTPGSTWTESVDQGLNNDD